jgi:cytochrome c oxidase assembly protein subunit 15
MRAMAYFTSTRNPAQYAARNFDARRQIAIWLFVCCGLVFLMVVVGGVTRLTHSGLSIVEWQPIVGTLPPINDAQWNTVFAKYQATPEYQQVNHGMSLDEFKGIFWWEYFHRLLGRLIGVAFFVPLLFFILRRRIERHVGPRLIGIFLLGGLQGAVGWYMVKSGLVDDPRVSQYRLTAHLGLAFLIYAAMFWTALQLLAPEWRPATDPNRRRQRRFGAFLSALIFLMVLSGGLVAGLRAGLAYNTFPLMNGEFMPAEIMQLDPWYLNFFSNMATVQFDHRLIAWSLMLLIPLFWLRSRSMDLLPRASAACTVLLLALAVQVALGIGTLLMKVPVGLAATHQAGALLLFTAALWSTHELR